MLNLSVEDESVACSTNLVWRRSNKIECMGYIAYK